MHLLNAVSSDSPKVFALDTNITSYKTDGLTTQEILGQVATTFNKLFGQSGEFICIVLCGNHAVVKKRSPGPIDCQQGLTKGIGPGVAAANLPPDLRPERDGMFMIVMVPKANLDSMLTALSHNTVSYYVDAARTIIEPATAINVFDTSHFPSAENPSGFFMDHSAFFLSPALMRKIFGGDGTVGISTANCASFIGEPVKEFQTLTGTDEEKSATKAGIQILNKYLYSLMGQMYNIPAYEMYNGFDTPHGKGASLKEGNHKATYENICAILTVAEPDPHARIASMIDIMTFQLGGGAASGTGEGGVNQLELGGAASVAHMDTTGLGGGNRKSKRRRNRKTQRRRRKSNRKKNRR